MHTFMLNETENIFAFNKYNTVHTFSPVESMTLTADGALKIGGDVIPDVVVPGVDSDEWVNLTVSVLVDDVNKGAFENFINYSTSGARRGYRIALWVNGEYVGMTANYARGESTAKDGFLLTDDQ